MISDVYDLYTMISKQCSKNRSKHAGAFINPNGVWTHSYNSHGVANLVCLQISGSNFNWWYAFLWPNRLKYWPLFTPLLLVFFGNDVCQLLFCCLGPYSHNIGIDFQLFYVLMLLEIWCLFSRPSMEFSKVFRRRVLGLNDRFAVLVL